MDIIIVYCNVVHTGIGIGLQWVPQYAINTEQHGIYHPYPPICFYDMEDKSVYWNKCGMLVVGNNDVLRPTRPQNHRHHLEKKYNLRHPLLESSYFWLSRTGLPSSLRQFNLAMETHHISPFRSIANDFPINIRAG